MTIATLNPHLHAAHHDPDAARAAVAMEEAEERRQLARRDQLRGRVHLAARLTLAAMFAATAVDKLLNFDATAKTLFNYDLNDSGFVVFLALAIELTGAVLLALGFATRKIAAGLSIYLGLVSLVALAYFPAAFSHLFLVANLGLVGGLLTLVAHGAGPLSLDARNEAAELAREA